MNIEKLQRFRHDSRGVHEDQKGDYLWYDDVVTLIEEDKKERERCVEVLKSAVGLKVEGKRVSHPMDAVAFLAEFGKWVDETFPGANHLEKLNDEVKELNEAPSSAMEMADVFLSLAAHAHRNGVDLLRWARLKFLVCKKRKWGPPDERGVIRHDPTIRGEEE